MKQRKVYGYELILDLHDCAATGLHQTFIFTFFKLCFRRRYLRAYFKSLCKTIRMEPAKLTFWDDLWCFPWNRQTKPHTTGTSAVQFIITSNITIHYLELTNSAYINIFSCKEFNKQRAIDVTKTWFEPESCGSKIVERI